MSRTTALAALIVELVADGTAWSKSRLRTGAMGLGLSESILSSTLTMLHRRGEIVMIRAGFDALYFRDRVAAEACPADVIESARAKKGIKAAESAKAARPAPMTRGPDAPVVTVDRAKTIAQSAKAIVTERTKITVVPTPLGRFEVDQASRPFGAGFAAVGIGRNVETGKPW